MNNYPEYHEINCPGCRKPLNVAAGRLNQWTRCPKCNRPILPAQIQSSPEFKSANQFREQAGIDRQSSAEKSAALGEQTGEMQAGEKLALGANPGWASSPPRRMPVPPSHVGWSRTIIHFPLILLRIWMVLMCLRNILILRSYAPYESAFYLVVIFAMARPDWFSTREE